MSFWRDLAYSYDKHSEIMGSLYPLSTTSFSNNANNIIVITIDENGKFVNVEKIEKADKNERDSVESITMPVTEKSLGRSSGICPHPVFDQYEYLKGDGDKFKAYIKELEKFAKSRFATGQIQAIYKYVSKGLVSKDLANMDVKDKTNIIFKVDSRESQTKVWENKDFFLAWQNYYLQQKENQKPTEDQKRKNQDVSPGKILDYISGEEQLAADSHPKKISNASANAKLISDNDGTNYTFRGRFRNSSEAFALGYESSQKAHQFLRYLITKRGLYCGEQVIVSYKIGEIDKPVPFFGNTKDTYEFVTENDKEIIFHAETGVNYSDALKRALGSYGLSKALKKHKRIAVFALDAATTGRLSITFYRELAENEYLERIVNWHDSCKWHQVFWDKEEKKCVSYEGAPSVDKIIETVYGKQRSPRDESYIKIKKTARERLLRCIFDGEFIPRDYILAAVHRVSNPLGVTVDGKFNRDGFEQILSVTCALVRKFYEEEDYKLSIELDRTDRDYLYGRLLGAADKLEEYVNRMKGNDRVTNALRYMNSFSQRPFKTWNIIHGQLVPYMQQFKGVAFDEMQSIMQKFRSGDFDGPDRPVNGTYLLGYYHERARIEELAKKLKDKSNAEKEGSNV
jgi:CRISPR-associated protein Csd1